MSDFKNYCKILATAFSLVVAFVALAHITSAQPWTVVASGLDNPRGLTFDNRGALLVAEAGIGGAGPCVIGAEGEVCYGPTGAVTRVWKGNQERIVTGLPSLADEEGFGATGPHDISGVGVGNMRVVIGLGNNPAVRFNELAPVGGAFGRMIQVSASGNWKYVADIAGFEAINNPDGGVPDSNPYSLISSPGGQIVADAGANAVLRVGNNGSISTLAVFPNRMALAPPFLGLPPGAMIPMQSVPNSVALGPDGLYYVGELTGFPFPVDAARVYRLLPDGTYEIAADGFTNIIDITFDAEGNLYVLEIAKNSLLNGIDGSLIRVAPDGTRTELASGGLVAPSSVAIGPDGGIYISNFGIFPGTGQVIRLNG